MSIAVQVNQPRQERLFIYGRATKNPKKTKTQHTAASPLRAPGRESMIVTVANIWWPKLHREVVGLAKFCQQSITAGKNIKPLLVKQNCKLPKGSEPNEHIAIDFARQFQSAICSNKTLLVSIDHFSGWPEEKFLRQPTTQNV